jgi:8-oxo-dGTP pyrophosphatase MutT (NUDIX family)
MTYPISVKGVLFIDGKVLLLRNERDEWELPGGHMDPGETHEQTLVREFQEELQIQVDPLGRIDSYDFEVIPSKHLHIVTYGCALRGPFNPVVSAEHLEFGLHALAELERIPLPAGYARSIRSWSANAQP